MRLCRNQLPNQKIRDELIEIVFKFFCKDYDIDYLEESRFGRVLMALKTHKLESMKNKKLLQKMYQTWSKKANAIQDDLSKMTKEDRRRLDDKASKSHIRPFFGLGFQNGAEKWCRKISYLRCGLHPSTLGAGGPNQNTSRIQYCIKKFTPFHL